MHVQSGLLLCTSKIANAATSDHQPLLVREISFKVHRGAHMCMQGNSNVRKAAPTTGFPGGGATAFPAEASGKGLRGEHLSDFDISKVNGSPKVASSA